MKEHIVAVKGKIGFLPKIKVICMPKEISVLEKKYQLIYSQTYISFSIPTFKAIDVIFTGTTVS